MGGAGQTMGENVSAGREGPNAQGVGRPIRTGQEAMGGIEANPGHHHAWVKRSARPEEDEEESMEEEDGEEENRDDNVWSRRRNKPIQPNTLTHHDFLHSGQAASTIAGGNFEGVIRDRLKAVSIPHSPDANPSRRPWNHMNEGLRKHIVKQLVEGKYDETGVLNGNSSSPKQPVLKDVANLTMLNASYLPRDGERLLEKVRSLLPVAKPAVAGKGQQRPQQVKK